MAIVFLHGVMVDGSLWDDVVDRLPDRECVVLELPLGSHTAPVADRSKLTPHGVAELILEELERRELHDVTLVGCDTGGMLAQLVVARDASRISRLVLTPCDALEVFPPALFKPLFSLGRFPLLMRAFLQPLRFTAARRLPIAFGWLTKRVVSERLARWGTPALRDMEILRDAAHFAAACDPAITLDVAPKLRSFKGRVTVLWPPEDPCFPFALGERVTKLFDDAELIEVEDSYCFVPVDRPDVLAAVL
jgi:pimeloyl-ACP methyl ester carboxylesterase